MYEVLAAVGFALMLLGALLAVGLLDPLPRPAPPYVAPAPARPRRRALPSIELGALPPTSADALVELDDPGWTLEGPTLLDVPVYQPAPPGGP